MSCAIILSYGANVIIGNDTPKTWPPELWYYQDCPNSDGTLAKVVLEMLIIFWVIIQNQKALKGL